ncbi:MAG: hypothetical protein ACE5KJ_02225, partial [Candidatus Zixiibacteriota bacterium]
TFFWHNICIKNKNVGLPLRAVFLLIAPAPNRGRGRSFYYTSKVKKFHPLNPLTIFPPLLF